jgi:hypothetical protein
VRRRGFLQALAGLALAPSLIERIRIEPRVWRFRKVQGEIAISGGVLAKTQAEEGAFSRYAVQALNESQAERAEFARIMREDLQQGLLHAQRVYNDLMAARLDNLDRYLYS